MMNSDGFQPVEKKIRKDFKNPGGVQCLVNRPDSHRVVIVQESGQ